MKRICAIIKKSVKRRDKDLFGLREIEIELKGENEKMVMITATEEAIQRKKI